MSIWNILFPAKCAFCGDAVEGDAIFCPICFSKYEQMKRKRCDCCGKMHIECRCVATKLRSSSLPVRQRHVFSFNEDMARTLIYKLKRKNLSRLQSFFAKECALAVRSEIRMDEKTAIVYPPRSKHGIMKYGFDQAEILAKEMGRILNLPVVNAFCHEGSEEQKTLTAGEREKNADKAYLLEWDTDLTGLTVIIVDDVVTSGSTSLRLCKLACIAGAKRSVVVSVAKTSFG